MRNYVTAFVKKLEEVKGNVPWHSYLNLDYFLKTAKMYGKTAARYRYEVLFDQLNDIPGDAERQSELAKLMKKLHPSLSGHRPPRPKKKEGFLAMLLKLRENFPVLPKTIRQKLSVLWRDYFSRMRRFFGSRRSWFHSWKYGFAPPARHISSRAARGSVHRERAAVSGVSIYESMFNSGIPCFGCLTDSGLLQR